MKNLIFAVVFFLTLTVLPNIIVAKEISSELSVDELKFIAKSMKIVEDSLQNIRIDSNAWMELGQSSSGPWEQTPIFWSTTAFLGNISSDKARIDFYKEVVPWTNGAASYIEKQYSVSFNGSEGSEKMFLSLITGILMRKIPERFYQINLCN